MEHSAFTTPPMQPTVERGSPTARDLLGAFLTACLWGVPDHRAMTPRSSPSRRRRRIRNPTDRCGDVTRRVRCPDRNTCFISRVLVKTFHAGLVDAGHTANCKESPVGCDLRHDIERAADGSVASRHHGCGCLLRATPNHGIGARQV